MGEAQQEYTIYWERLMAPEIQGVNCTQNCLHFEAVIHRGAQVVRVLVPLLDGNQRQTRAAKVKKVLFAEKRKERLHEVMQWDLEAGGLLSQVGNRVL
jgi:hypothetical protein